MIPIKIFPFLIFIVLASITIKFFLVYAGNDDIGYYITDCTTSGTILKAESRYMGVSSSSGEQPKHDACDTNDILVCTGYQTGIILSACNIGSGLAGSGVDSYGMYFQYGRNKGFYYQTGALYEDVLISSQIGKHAGIDMHEFIYTTYHDGTTDWNSWYNAKINENWGSKLSSSLEKQGPCADGYHIPTFEELKTVLKANSSVLNFFPKSGLLVGDYGKENKLINYIDNNVGSYWVITQDKNNPGLNQFALNIRPNNEIEMVNYDPGNGLSVRCFKNLGEEKVSYNTEKIQVTFSEFKEAFQEYFEVESNNYFQKFGKTYQLVPILEHPIYLETNIWMFQDYKERLKNEVIYKKGGKYFYSDGGYYFVRIK